MLAIAVAGAAAVLAPGSLGDRVAGPCIGASPHAPMRLPAPITIAAGYSHVVGYRIECDGRVGRIGRLPPAWPFPSDAACCVAPGVWWAVRHGHLVIVRGRRTMWRSRGEFLAKYGVGGIVLGRRAIAFSYGNNLYLAPRHGAERLLGRAEYALGFTRGGVYTLSWVRGLILRSDRGAVLKTIVHWPTGSDCLVVGGRLFFIAHGVLISARGRNVQRLASIASLGMSPETGLQQVGPLLELQDNDRLVLMRLNGSVFASTSIPRQAQNIAGLTVAPDVSAAAFAAPEQQARAETVYLLRAGTHAAVPLLTERNVPFRVCAGGWAAFQWHGPWLLYSSTENRVAAIRVIGARRVIELSRWVAGLRGAHGTVTAYWAGQPPAFY